MNPRRGKGRRKAQATRSARSLKKQGVRKSKTAKKPVPPPPPAIEPERRRWIGPLDYSPLAFMTLKWALEEPENLPDLLQRITWLAEMLKEQWQHSRLRIGALPYVARAIGRQLASHGVSPTDDQVMRAERLLTQLLNLGEPRRDISKNLDPLRVFTVKGPRGRETVCEACGIAEKADPFTRYCVSRSCSFVCVGCGDRVPVAADGLPPANLTCAPCAACQEKQ
jgi:hypothetical protein